MQKVFQKPVSTPPAGIEKKSPDIKTSKTAKNRFPQPSLNNKRVSAKGISFGSLIKSAVVGYFLLRQKAAATTYSESYALQITNNTGSLGHALGTQLNNSKLAFAWPDSLSGRVTIFDTNFQQVLPEITITNFDETTIIPHAPSVGGFIVSGLNKSSGNSKAGFQTFNTTNQPSSAIRSLYTIYSGNQTNLASTTTPTLIQFAWYDPDNIDGAGIYQRLYSANSALTATTLQETQVATPSGAAEPVLFSLGSGSGMLYVDGGNAKHIMFASNGNIGTPTTVNTNTTNLCVCPCATSIGGNTHVICFAKVDGSDNILGYYFRRHDGSNYLDATDQPIITGSLGIRLANSTLIDVRPNEVGFVVTFYNTGTLYQMIFSNNGTLYQGATVVDPNNTFDVSGLTLTQGWGTLYQNITGLFFKMFQPTILTTTTPSLTSSSTSTTTTPQTSSTSTSTITNPTTTTPQTSSTSTSTTSNPTTTTPQTSSTSTTTIINPTTTTLPQTSSILTTTTLIPTYSSSSSHTISLVKSSSTNRVTIIAISTVLGFVYLLATALTAFFSIRYFRKRSKSNDPDSNITVNRPQAEFISPYTSKKDIELTVNQYQKHIDTTPETIQNNPNELKKNPYARVHPDSLKRPKKNTPPTVVNDPNTNPYGRIDKDTLKKNHNSQTPIVEYSKFSELEKKPIDHEYINVPKEALIETQYSSFSDLEKKDVEHEYVNVKKISEKIGEKD